MSRLPDDPATAGPPGTPGPAGACHTSFCGSPVGIWSWGVPEATAESGVGASADWTGAETRQQVSSASQGVPRRMDRVEGDFAHMRSLLVGVELP